MFCRPLFNAFVTMAFSATATARRTWLGAENCWRCRCPSRHRNATTGSGGSNSPGTIHWSVRSAATVRWCASPSFRLAAPSKNVTAHKLCSLPHCVWLAGWHPPWHTAAQPVCPRVNPHRLTTPTTPGKQYPLRIPTSNIYVHTIDSLRAATRIPHPPDHHGPQSPFKTHNLRGPPQPPYHTGILTRVLSTYPN